jgi:hypothetical protein
VRQLAAAGAVVGHAAPAEHEADQSGALSIRNSSQQAATRVSHNALNRISQSHDRRLQVVKGLLELLLLH